VKGNEHRIPLRREVVAVLALLLAACGGGGGGGGGGGAAPSGGDSSGGAAPSNAVVFTGFEFRVNTGPPVDEPPMEDPAGGSVGAPLNTTILFHFAKPNGKKGIPAGPFNSETLPVFTTPSEVTPEAMAPAGTPVILAKGTYVKAGSTVEFHPFVPTVSPLSINLSSPPDSVPGLLPGSIYTASVTTSGPDTIGNLVGTADGVDGAVQFGTTSNPANFFISGESDGKAPVLLSTDPADGATDFSPNIFSNVSLANTDTGIETFPTADTGTVTLTYDRALDPSSGNLVGSDLDGDDVLDPTFFFRTRATRILVAHEVPAGSSLGNTLAFPALSGLSEGVPPGEDEVFLHNSSEGDVNGLSASPTLTQTPGTMALARDGSLLYVVLPVDGGNDLLTVVDHVIGDPLFASIDVAGALDTGLDDLVGVTTLLDGRLVGYDRTTRRIYELLTDVTRQRPLGEPTLTSVELGDGSDGFQSAEMTAGLELVALAQAPDGRLYGLADQDPTGQASPTLPAVVRLTTIDGDLDGEFEAGEGLWEQTVLPLFATYADLAFRSGTEALALNRSASTIDVVDLELGTIGTAVSLVGTPLGGQPSPATSLVLGFMELDARGTLLAEQDGEVPVELRPRGILPFGTELEVHERAVFRDLGGINRVIAEDAHPLGSRALLTVTTAQPAVGPLAPVDDVFLEEFESDALEDETPMSLAPLAEWAEKTKAGTVSEGLRASIGVVDAVPLGNFEPPPNPDFVVENQFSPPGILSGPFNEVLLNTDAQNLPLLDGSTPGIDEQVTVFGGRFAFEDFIIPEGVRVSVTGSNPLVITATGKIEIRGVLEVAGQNGTDDDTFNTGFIPVPGGAGGPGGGRGGNGHPTIFDPEGGSNLDQYATPERGQDGFGPTVDAQGNITFAPIGGRGGLSTAGFTPYKNESLPNFGFPKVPNAAPTGTGDEKEAHRPPGGGGGSFYIRGFSAHTGTGEYRVQSFNNGNYAPFNLCPTDNKIQDAKYGNEERRCQGQLAPFLQCVYMSGNPLPPGGGPGDWPFADGDRDNDYIGAGGEVPFLMGGQGGGGGGTRIDSMDHSHWSIDHLGSPVAPGLQPPCYPKLVFGPMVSPTVYDAKGGGGGGGGGAVLLRSFGDIVVAKTGHIHANGGRGGGGEQVGNGNYAASGGGGSGGAIVLQAAGEIRLEADPSHSRPHFTDTSADPGTIPGAQGACLDVSGGQGKDALTKSDGQVSQIPEKQEWSSSDGGHGGFGLIQLQQGSGDGVPQIQQGAFAWAGVWAFAKLGDWNNTLEDGKGGLIDMPSNDCRHDNAVVGKQKEHGNDPDILDMLDWRIFNYDERTKTQDDFYYVVHGHDPPIIPVEPVTDFEPTATVPAGVVCPFDRPPYINDTEMMDYFGKRVVREPQPQLILQEYTGEANAETPELDPPGTLYPEDADIPFVPILTEPGGELPLEMVDGELRVPDELLIDRLPIVPLGITPPPLAAVSQGMSEWLDFAGVVLRMRDAQGVPPPFFAAVNGTYNAASGPVPPGLAGRVVTSGDAPNNQPAQLVAGAGPLDPGLFGPGGPDVPTNDIKVDAPELSLPNAISNNASVTYEFQGGFPVRAGGHVPDPATLSAWVADLTELDGYPLVRFRVRFDLEASTDPDLSFGPDSMRPLVDYVRLRPTY